jgi:predicted transport protein
MKAIDRPLPHILNGASQFVIPVFQRDYTWQAETQCAQLWGDIVRASRTKGEQGHFLGSIVYIPTGDNAAGFTQWLLIDGQQRLTTITLLMAALRDHIEETGWSGGEQDPTAKRIDAYFLRNVHEEGNRALKLVLRRHDQETLAAILNKQPPPEQASENISENYAFFREQLEQTDPSDVYRGIARLLIVDVSLDRLLDDPQLIFESLNSTGVDLSQSDLIRNFILMRLPEKQQTALYNNYWSKIEALFRGSEWTFDAFARDYVALMSRATKQEKSSEIYYAFRSFFPDLKERLGSFEACLEHMFRFAQYHAAISLGRGVTGDRARQLAKLRQLVDVPVLLVMQLFDCRDQTTSLTDEEFIEAIALIESYVLRRAICGYQTRGYWQIFANLAYSTGTENVLARLKVAFARLRDSYRFPTDEEFRRALRENDVYGLRVCRHLLEGLENYGSKEPSDISAYSIEHILPQNERLRAEWRQMLGDDWKAVQKTWLHRLGNLTLTGYNSKYSDRSFEDKKTIAGGFSESSVRLNKYVRERSAWTAQEIETRTRHMADRASAIWKALAVDKQLLDAENQAEKQALAARGDFQNVPMSEEASSIVRALRTKILEIDDDVIELAEKKSISYHAPNFFLEVLPRRYRVGLLLALDFDELDDPLGIAQDATQWKFLVNASHEGGVLLHVSSIADIENAIPLIRQAHAASED